MPVVDEHKPLPTLSQSEEQIIQSVYGDLANSLWQLTPDRLAAKLNKEKSAVLRDIESLGAHGLVRRHPQGFYLLDTSALEYMEEKQLADRTRVVRNKKIVDGILSISLLPVEKQAESERQQRDSLRAQGVEDQLFDKVSEYIRLLRQT